MHWYLVVMLIMFFDSLIVAFVRTMLWGWHLRRSYVIVLPISRQIQIVSSMAYIIIFIHLTRLLVIFPSLKH